jgi:hypothetical protein
MNELKEKLEKMCALNWEREGKAMAKEIAAQYTSSEEVALIQEYMNKCAEEIGRELDDAIAYSRRVLTVKEQLKEVSEIVSMKYIAEHYFNKSAAWLSQRINGTAVRGQVYGLKEKDIETLNYALHDIGQKLGSFTLV